MRWIQKVNEDGTSRFEPRDEAARQNSMGLAIHGDIEAFVSPVDGSLITDRKALREHNKRNNVVNSAEFDQGFLDRKRKERERLYTGEHTPAEKRARGHEINEIINHLQNQG
jgi:hypothetical protein